MTYSRRVWSWEHFTFAAQLEIGVLRQEAEGKRKKEGARRSFFTNMRCSLWNLPKVALFLVTGLIIV